ncbi:MAG: NADH-quinone oxidoreductase subunit L [Chloroflexi bacterium]|nr:NADH-quinone oxidoreductase subunit L [Chloroflexota bacterium]
MIPEIVLWLIFFIPLGSFLIIAGVIRPFFNRYAFAAGYLTIAAMASALVISIIALASVINEHAGIEYAAHRWLDIGPMNITIGITLDALTGIMLVVVTAVSLMVQIYSTAYMKGDKGYARYYAYMSLFTMSMIGLVLASSVIQIFVFWELVGLCSYLLIGFWYHKPSAAAAAKKAFIVTRIGDFGLLLGILYLFFNQDTLAASGLNSLIVADVNTAAAAGIITSGVATWLAVGIFAGAVGKSAQIPLHTWLPDAMEGPTPVSALIHAATMVAAGVFLVARFFPLFEASKEAMAAVAIIGGVTALFAATIGLVQNDIKRVLAYSTISQLGYMMLALGVGAYGAAIFHLFTHAFFKGLLFLGSGSVSHASGGTFDMRYMGGLRKIMPWTYVTFLIGSLALAGIFPLSGFWSKDEILAHAWGNGDTVSRTVFWLGLIAAFMTAFYMFRALFMTFEGEFRGGAAKDPNAEAHDEGETHPHESPWAMVGPLVVLALAAGAIGFIVNPTTSLGIVPIHWFTEFVSGHLHHETPEFNIPVALISSVLALAGIVLAYGMYGVKRSAIVSPADMGRWFRPLYQLFLNKYWFDEFYEKLLVKRVFYRGLAQGLDWSDKYLVDGLVRVIDRVGKGTGRVVSHLQNGQLQGYGLGISVGIVLIFGIYLAIR